MDGHNLWQQIVETDYAVPAGYTVAELTPSLLDALGSTDAQLRDEYALSILAAWLEREGSYTPNELRAMAAQLCQNLLIGLGEQNTASVFLRSFSALTLDCVIDYDNQHPFLDAAEVQRILDQALSYLAAEQDLRGYVPEQGWAHAVAHAADLCGFLARSRQLGMAHLERMLAAITDRVLVQVDHVYLYDEDERLALAVMTVLRRELVGMPFLTAWLERLARPLGDITWVAGAADRAQLSAYQNAEMFLRCLYFQLAFGDRAPAFLAEDAYFAHVPLLREALLPQLEVAIRSLGRGFYPDTSEQS